MQQQPFDPISRLTKISGNDYLEVKWRLVWLRDVYPDAEVQTELISEGSWTNPSTSREVREAVFRCIITVPSGGSASGYGSESSDDFRDYREKAETKAIGRACAVLGFGTQFAPEFSGEAAAGRPVDAPVRNPNIGAENGRSENQGGFQGQVAGTARYPQEGQNAPQRPQNAAQGSYGAGVTQAQPAARPPQPIRPPGQGNVQQAQQGQQQRQQQGQGQPAQIQDPNAPASPKQIQYVIDLLSGLGFDPNAIDFDGVTKGEASGYIETLRSGNVPQEFIDAMNAIGAGPTQ
jgi:hypothetical protein